LRRRAPFPERTCARCGHLIADGSPWDAFAETENWLICRKCRAPVIHKGVMEAVTLRGKSLSPRDLQICQFLVDSLANKEIAYRMGLTAGTVKYYVWRIMQKTGAANRGELAMRTERDNVQKAKLLEDEKKAKLIAEEGKE
jgi:DNA-binding CsgD family transcriptional regulator